MTGTIYRVARTVSPSRDGVTAATSALPSVGLAEVLAHAELQTRLDRKYLMPVRWLPALLDRLGRDLRVLEIEGRRAFGYESVYFDTPDLLSYRHHVQGQRRRFKVRTRTYLDSGDCVLEVKVVGGRSETVKHRTAYGSFDRYHLDGAARRFITDHVHWPHAIDRLRPTVVTSYHRITMVDLASELRLTCDIDLSCRAGDRVMTGLHDHVLVETKSSGRSTAAARAFHEIGVRSAPLSKYCLAVATLYDDVRTNPWRRTLRRYFPDASARSARSTSSSVE